jgi:hypothetical protein
MNEPRPQGLPLTVDRDALHAGALCAFFRFIVANARSRIDPKGRSPAEIATKAWPHDRQLDLLMRAAATPNSTTDTASAIAPITAAYLAAMAPLSAAASLIDASFKLRFDRVAQIHIPSITTAPQMAFVAEGEPLPVAMGISTRLILSVRKLAGIVGLSSELYSHSYAEDLIRQVLLENSSPAIDSVMFSQAAGSATSPPGLFHNVTPIAPAANSFRLDNLVEDIGNLVGAVAQFAGTGNVAIVAAPAQWASLKLRTPTTGFPVWSSTALPVGTVAAIALPTFVSANGDPPTFDLSTVTALTTTDPGSEFVTSGGVVGAPTLSSFQADLVALKLNMPVTWGLRAPGVSWLQGANW